MARLGAPQQEAADAAGAGRVSAAVLSARPAARLRAHPALRVLGPPAPCEVAPLVLRAAGRNGRIAIGHQQARAGYFAITLDLPTVRRPDGDCREIHRHRSAIARSSTSKPRTMTCSLTSRTHLARRRQHSDCVGSPHRPRPARCLRHQPPPDKRQDPVHCFRRASACIQIRPLNVPAGIQNP